MQQNQFTFDREMELRNHDIFMKFFVDGDSQTKIARELGVSGVRVCTILNQHAADWIAFNINVDTKEQIAKLAAQGKNTVHIAEILGKPWNRYSIQFILKYLQVAQTIAQKPIFEQEPAPKLITLRCPIDNRPFQTTTIELKLNPDRLCPTCIDRRNDERRKGDERRARDSEGEDRRSSTR